MNLLSHPFINILSSLDDDDDDDDDEPFILSSYTSEDLQARAQVQLYKEYAQERNIQTIQKSYSSELKATVPLTTKWL